MLGMEILSTGRFSGRRHREMQYLPEKASKTIVAHLQGTADTICRDFPGKRQCQYLIGTKQIANTEVTCWSLDKMP